MDWPAAYHAVEVLVYTAFALVVLEMTVLWRTGQWTGWIHSTAYYVTWIIADAGLLVTDFTLHHSLFDKITDTILVAWWIWLAFHDPRRKNKRKTLLGMLGAKTRAVYESMRERMGLQPQREGA